MCVAGVTVFWHQIERDLTYLTNILDTVRIESAIECGVTCSNLPGCRGFDFSEKEMECVLHDATIVHPNNQNISRGDVIYQNFSKLKNIISACKLIT